MDRKITAGEIIRFLQNANIEVEHIGEQEHSVTGYASLKDMEDNKLIWVKKWTKEIYDALLEREGNFVVCKPISEEFDSYPERSMNYFICDDPKMCFFEIVGGLFLDREKECLIADTAKVYTANIGKNVSVGDFTTIGPEAVIGDNVVIGDRVSIIGKVSVGDDSVIQSGAVIGEAGYGYYLGSDGHRKKVPHLGGVRIGNHVEIGANSCIDRGTMDDTVIGDHCKIDNLCHVAHNVKMEQDVMIVAGSVICGSAEIGSGTYIAPGAVIQSQLKIGKDVFVGMQSLVTRNIKDGESFFGVPAKPFVRFYEV